MPSEDINKGAGIYVSLLSGSFVHFFLRRYSTLIFIKHNLFISLLLQICAYFEVVKKVLKLILKVKRPSQTYMRCQQPLRLRSSCARPWRTTQYCHTGEQRRWRYEYQPKQNQSYTTMRDINIFYKALLILSSHINGTEKREGASGGEEKSP